MKILLREGEKLAAIAAEFQMNIDVEIG